MTGSVYGETFAHWRAGCPGPWRDYTHHAFVEGLRNGSLSRASFLHYLVQDYVFLVHFARAWSLAVVKAETLDEMKICAGTVDALVNHEMALHVTTCAAQGIDEAALFGAVEEFENLAYTRYVMDAGLQGDFLDLMAALAPCCFGYGEIGLRLARSAAPDTPYRDWIDTYSDPEYQTVMASVGQMIDGAIARRLGPDPTTSQRWPNLQARFTTATRLEVAFWDMGLRGG
ncbi:thiaminase/transcriptional activator TenA [Loktanella sp. PT4BL]|jgi:thiaminase/transcriptional activator TenA|uniref:TenA family protein n=1 Tax=Loktanella sp. PT4BL TaxID=2135611 RepID=UPI000D768244|nr:TenA family protein [Loktanella sp. PT4BL]PXW71019.1 thiaminase/transcriptional activator TenA [Loktanella sp. PT4BL]